MCKPHKISRIICPDCNGHKTTEAGWEFHGHSRGHTKITEPCEACGGEGIVIQEIYYKTISGQSGIDVKNNKTR